MKANMVLTMSLVLAAGMFNLEHVQGAGALSGAAIHEARVQAKSLNKLSVGLDFDDIDREVMHDNDDNDLRERISGNTISAFLGYDLQPWMVGYVIAGKTDAELTDGSIDRENHLHWALGLDANWWQSPIKGRDRIKAVISIGSMLKYGRYEANSGNDDVNWHEFTLGVPLQLELLAKETTSLAQPYSLVLFAGPVWSPVDGERDFGDLQYDFESSDDFGYYGGMNIYFDYSFSIGAQFRKFKDAGYGVNLRYHF